MAFDTGMTFTAGGMDYEIGALIKEGGFGKVFRAVQKGPFPFTTNIALKVPADHVLANEVWLKKFEREARILANIHHPNVVKIVAFFNFDDGSKALAQELIEGAEQLHLYLRKNPNNLARAGSVFVQTLYAMRAFHGAGSDQAAIHRDLSPANILVNAQGLVKVIDFGLAKEDPRRTEILTQTHEAFGTIGCMAPEQMLGAADVDHRADLYALGRSITASFQNRHPMHADPSALPEPWKTICVRLTQHDRDNRYADASAALAETFRLFAMHSIALEDFSYHVNEMVQSPEMDGWPLACALHFSRLPDINASALHLASRLGSEVLARFNDSATPLTADAFFDKIEAGTAIAAFNAGNVSFDDSDPLGDLYASLYPALDPSRQLRCFQRLVTTALHWHRYHIMGCVRRVFEIEKDPAMAAMILAALNEMDPSGTIHGHSVIPGR